VLAPTNLRKPPDQISKKKKKNRPGGVSMVFMKKGLSESSLKAARAGIQETVNHRWTMLKRASVS
jgi:hypothetical protein